jgi:hypothetical protein
MKPNNPNPINTAVNLRRDHPAADPGAASVASVVVVVSLRSWSALRRVVRRTVVVVEPLWSWSLRR